MSEVAPSTPWDRAGPLLISGAFAALTWWTWGTWPDVLVDFGRELYSPWRITQGAVLYRDLASFNGPLSPYLNALWFTLGGASLRTLFVANLVLLALFTALLYRLLARIGDAFSATLAVLAFLCVGAFGQLVFVGNYNFVAPYAHELTHGLMLAVAAVAALARWRQAGTTRWLALGASCAGLALLTKAETGLAALAASLLLFLWPREAARWPGVRASLLFALLLLVPAGIATSLLSLAMPVPQAAAGVASPWTSLLRAGALDLPFYRELMGITHPWLHLRVMLVWAGIWWLALAPAMALAENWRIDERRARVATAFIFAAYAAVLFAVRDWIAWSDAPMPLTLVAGGALAVALVQALREGPERWLPAAAFAVVALVLLGKMALRPRLSHYGFALATPSLALAVIALGAWLPAWLARRGARVAFVRAAMVALVAALSAAHLSQTAGFLGRKQVVVGEGGDAFRADARGREVRPAVEALRALPAGATVLVLPEGVTLNFLARRASPVAYVNFMPLELRLFREQAMLDALRQSAPDAVVLVHKSTREFGVPWFGRDYGLALMAWVRENYAPVRTFGDEPLTDEARFGIQVWMPR